MTEELSHKNCPENGWQNEAAFRPNESLLHGNSTMASDLHACFPASIIYRLLYAMWEHLIKVKIRPFTSENFLIWLHVLRIHLITMTHNLLSISLLIFFNYVFTGLTSLQWHLKQISLQCRLCVNLIVLRNISQYERASGVSVTSSLLIWVTIRNLCRFQS